LILTMSTGARDVIASISFCSSVRSFGPIPMSTSSLFFSGSSRPNFLKKSFWRSLSSFSTSVAVDEGLLSDCFIDLTQLLYYYHYYATWKETLSLNEDSYHLHQIQMNPIHFSLITSL
jgi:hypothetical protein